MTRKKGATPAMRGMANDDLAQTLFGFEVSLGALTRLNPEEQPELTVTTCSAVYSTFSDLLRLVEEYDEQAGRVILARREQEQGKRK